MKKLFYLSTLCMALILGKNAYSQEAEVEWGPQQKEIKNTYIDDVISHTDDGYYILRIKSGGFFSSPKYYIEKYDKSHKVEFAKEFKVETKQKKDGEFNSIHATKDGFTVFFTYYDSKSDKKILYAMPLGYDGKASQPEEVDFIKTKKKSQGGFDIIISPDGSKILVWRIEAFDKKANEKFTYKVFSNTLNLIWEKDIELPYKDKSAGLVSCRMDNEGNIYTLIRVGTEIKGSGLLAKNTTVYDYKLVACNNKSTELDEIPLSLGGAKKVTDVSFVIDESKNKIIVTGFYAGKDSKGTGKGLTGVIFMRIDKSTFKIEFENNAPFDKKFLVEVSKNRMSDKKAKKAESINTNYDLDHVIIKEDGGIVLIAEEYYVHVVTTRDSKGNTTTTYYYYYNNIIAVNLLSDGSILWANVIPKMQVSTNDGGPYASYVAAYHNGNLHFWYNDNPKNTSAKTKPDKVGAYVMNRPKKALVTHAMLDKNGEKILEPFFKSKNDSKTIFKPKIRSYISNNEILVYAEKGSTYKFGTLKIQ